MWEGSGGVRGVGKVRRFLQSWPGLPEPWLWDCFLTFPQGKNQDSQCKVPSSLLTCFQPLMLSVNNYYKNIFD